MVQYHGSEYGLNTHGSEANAKPGALQLQFGQVHSCCIQADEGSRCLEGFAEIGREVNARGTGTVSQGLL